MQEQQLSTKHKTEDYETSLWNEIRNRMQHPSEKVVYVAIIENLYRRLTSLPIYSTRSNLIKLTALPRHTFAVHPINSTDELTQFYCSVENAHHSVQQFKLPLSNFKHLFQPDLAFHRDSLKTNTASMSSTALAENYLQETLSFTSHKNDHIIDIAAIIYWNCKQSSCYKKLPRIFNFLRYKYGQSNLTIRSCPRCAQKRVSKPTG